MHRSRGLDSSQVSGAPSRGRNLSRRTRYVLPLPETFADRCDQYFDTRRHVLDAFELQLKALLLSLSNSAKLRHSLQTSLGELQSALLSLSQCDLSTSLKSILEQAAAVQRKLRELSEAQSSAEEQIGGLTSVAEGYSRLCASVKVRSSLTAESASTLD